MSPLELEHYLHEQIPLSAAMQVSVVAASAQEVVLGAPLDPNVNHQDTVFGGSASALAILAAWSLLHTKLAASGIDARLVIRRNTMRYERPMAARFTARAAAPSADDWEAFARSMKRKGLGRIAMTSTLWCDGREAGRLEGEFVAMRVTIAEVPIAGANNADHTANAGP